MIRIAVVDDEKECIEKIKRYFDGMSEYKAETFYADSAELLLKKYDDGERYDIIFLDIEMNGISGIDAAKRICAAGGSPLIIFTTAHKKYVNEAFYVNAFQYMFKPIEYSDLRYELDRAVKTIALRHSTFEINFGHEKVILKSSDIIYIETRGRHLSVKTADNEYLYNDTVKEVEKKLSKLGFSKIEQGIIVNLCHVRRVTPTAVELDNGETKYISRRAYKSFLSELNRYLSGA